MAACRHAVPGAACVWLCVARLASPLPCRLAPRPPLLASTAVSSPLAGLRLDVLGQAHGLLAEVLCGGDSPRLRESRGAASKAGVPKAVSAHLEAAIKQKGGGEQRIQLLENGLRVLRALAPTPAEGVMDFKSADAVLHVFHEEANTRVQAAGLAYLVEAITPPVEEGMPPSDVEKVRREVIKRQGYLVELHLAELVVRAMQTHETTGEHYALHCAGCQALRFLTAGRDGAANERRHGAAEAGAIPIVLAAIKAYPKDEKKAKKEPLAHLIDHAVGTIRNITAASDELSRKAREAGARKEWVTKGK